MLWYIFLMLFPINLFFSLSLTAKSSSSFIASKMEQNRWKSSFLKVKDKLNLGTRYWYPSFFHSFHTFHEFDSMQPGKNSHRKYWYQTHSLEYMEIPWREVWKSASPEDCLRWHGILFLIILSKLIMPSFCSKTRNEIWSFISGLSCQKLVPLDA